MTEAQGGAERYSVDATDLVHALERVKQSGKKSLIRSSDHIVSLDDPTAGSSRGATRSALIEEGSDDDVDNERDDCSSRTTAREGTLKLTSWKTQEFAYRKTSRIGYEDADGLPTLARGLFTCSNGQGKHRIVVRGYDKFFNEGEMPWTKPDSIAGHSRAPYELTFKENGCIIFIAALTSRQLIVTSKHSLGANESHAVSHAQKGEEWLERHLASVNKRKVDLARQLWDRNETAVAELCDDSFEEHVLAYPSERWGLHLHGLNANTSQFCTQSSAEVEKFAIAWGFLPTRYLVLDSIEEVNEFTLSVAETGKWQGTAIEGFVVRTRMPGLQDSPFPKETKGKAPVAPPYADGQSWFYKVKFDEPYLMYRDWRELTRKMVADKESYDKAALHSRDAVQRPCLPKTKNKRPETILFVQWGFEQLHGSADGTRPAKPDLFEKLHQNQGIIKLRETFVQYMGTTEGIGQLKKWRKVPVSIETLSKPFNRTLLVPIAIPGCGKTALAIALQHLFRSMGHTQSDDVQTKKTGPTFLRNIAKELDEHVIVFADRNNHLFKHRDEIVKGVKDWEAAPAIAANRVNGAKKKTAPLSGSSQERHVRLVAIVWPVDDVPLNAAHHVCSDRLVVRGVNHQSLRVDSGKEHEQVLWQFLQTRQPFRGHEGPGEEGVGDGEFHNVITLDFQSTLTEMVQSAVNQLCPTLGLHTPSPAEIKASVHRAGEYRVSVKKDVKAVPSPPIRYYGLSVEADIEKALQTLIFDHKDAREALERLVKEKRVVSRPHVTLVHNSEVKAGSAQGIADEKVAPSASKWEYYSTLYKSSKSAVTFTLVIDCLVWNDRAMSMGVQDITNEHGIDLASLQGSDWRPHITVGTFADDIRPYEGRKVLCEADARSTQVARLHFPQPLLMSARLRGLN